MMKKITFLFTFLVISFGYSQTVLENFETTTFAAGSLVGDSGMATTPEVVVDPATGGTNGNVLKIVTSADGNGWQNAQLFFQGADLDLTTSNKIVTVDVYSESAFMMLAKTATSLNGGAESATDASHSGAGWETLSFDFSDPKDGTPVANDVFGRILFFPQWNGAGWNASSVTTTYVDNIIGLAAAVETSGPDLIITGTYDGSLTGGTPKGIELYVVNDISDLSIYGVGSANNGGGTDGKEFTFPADAVVAGTFLYVATETPDFETFFGFAPNYTSGSMAINGDDAVELFKNDAVIETFGDIDTDGNGEDWEYLDGWAYRNNGTTSDGAFVIADWSFSGVNGLEGGTNNATATSPFPIGSYTIGGTSDGDYCEKVVAHLGLSDQAASEIKLTVVNSGEKSMKVTIESNNDDAVDFILIPGDVTGSPTQSDVDESIAGKMSITLTWPETAPTDVVFNLLWSKLSTAGNWQLGDAPTTFKFDATCATASIDDKLLVSFSMYPNPASNSLNISASSMIKNAVIYNILGKQVMNLSINKNSESINVSNLASGMYLIKYTTESAIGTAKFIKK